MQRAKKKEKENHQGAEDHLRRCRHSVRRQQKLEWKLRARCQ